jgi:LysR family nitrogen assimilation transcriptional regulator
VVVGMAPSISAMLAPSLLRRATAELPNVSLALVDELSSVLMEWLLAGRLDIAIGYEMLQSAHIAGDPLLVEDIFLVQSATSLPRLGKTLGFSQLSKFDLLLPASTHGLREIVERRATERGISLAIRCEVQSIHLIKELIGQGIGASLLPYGAVRHECEQGRLVAAKIVDPEINRTAYLAHVARRQQSNAETATLRLIRDVAKTEAGPNTALWHSIAALTPDNKSAVASTDRRRTPKPARIHAKPRAAKQ